MRIVREGCIGLMLIAGFASQVRTQEKLDSAKLREVMAHPIENGETKSP